MADATSARNTPTLDTPQALLSFSVADGYVTVQGTIGMLNADGYLMSSGLDEAGLTCAGLVQQNIDNSANLTPAPVCNVMSCVAQLANGSSITIASIGANAYALDNQTVTTTSSGHSLVGKIINVDANGVWVHLGLL